MVDVWKATSGHGLDDVSDDVKSSVAFLSDNAFRFFAHFEKSAPELEGDINISGSF
jgi:hypothetical protein